MIFRLRWGRCDDFVINEVLNLMTETNRAVGVMNMLLVKGTVFRRVIVDSK